ncbi:SdpI family protein [Saccharomonospora sp. NPDC006951]
MPEEGPGWGVAWGVAAMLVAVSLCCVPLARAMASGNLPRNHTVGLRIKATMRSDAAWIAGNRAAASLVRRTAIATAVTGACTVPVAGIPVLYLMVMACWAGVLVGGMWKATGAAREAALEADGSRET